MDVLFSNIKEKWCILSPIAKATIAFVFCNILQKGISYLSTPFFIRMMTTEQYGQFALYQSWFNILLVFATLKLSAVSCHRGLIIYKTDQSRFLSSMLGLSTVVTIFTAIVYYFLSPFLSKITTLPNIVILFIFLELFTEPALNFWSTYQRHHYKYKALLCVTILITILQPSISLFAVSHSTEKGLARIISVSVFNSAVGLLFYFYLFIKGKKLYVKEYWEYALKFNVPLVPHYLSNIILAQSDRLMIAYFLGNEEAAIYSLAYQISMAMSLITSAINSSMQPWLLQNCKANNYKKIKTVGNSLIIGVAILTLIPSFFAPEIIAFFGGVRYVGGASLVPPVSLSVFFQFLYFLFVIIEYFYGKTSFVTTSTVAAAILNIILNYIFIPILGYVAAAYTTIISYIFYSIGHYYFMNIILKKNNVSEKPYSVKVIIGVSFILCTCSIIITFLYSKNPIIRYTLFSIILIAVFKKRNSVKETILYIIKKK